MGLSKHESLARKRKQLAPQQMRQLLGDNRAQKADQGERGEKATRGEGEGEGVGEGVGEGEGEEGRGTSVS